VRLLVFTIKKCYFAFNLGLNLVSTFLNTTQAEKSVGFQQRCLIELALVLDLVSRFTLIKNNFYQIKSDKDQCRLLHPEESVT